MSQDYKNNDGKMVSLLGAHLNKLVTVFTEAGTSFTGILKEIKSDVVENYIVLSTYSSSRLHLDGSKILAFDCDEHKPLSEDKELISKFYTDQRGK